MFCGWYGDAQTLSASSVNEAVGVIEPKAHPARAVSVKQSPPVQVSSHLNPMNT